MIPDKKQQILMTLLMSASMALVMSGFFTLIYAQSIKSFFIFWLSHFLMGFPVAFITSMLIGRKVQNVVSKWI